MKGISIVSDRTKVLTGLVALAAAVMLNGACLNDGVAKNEPVTPQLLSVTAAVETDQFAAAVAGRSVALVTPGRVATVDEV